MLPVDLLAHSLREVVTRAGIDPVLVDDVIAGAVTQVGDQAVNIARNAALGAGFPESVPGATIDRQCGSSQQAIHFAAQGVIAGAYDVVIAAGVESMSRVPMGSSVLPGSNPFGAMAQPYPESLVPQGISAEMMRLGLRPLARIHTTTVVGSDPLYMLTGVIPATEKVLTKAGLTLSDIDLFEVNEAFAPVVLAWARDTGADLAKTNVNGGAIAIGHPLGASGARIMTTLVNALEQRGGRYGLQTMCEGGGMANATIIERL